MNEFGKDLGLVHEAVITGRKVGAGTTFWATLAENQKLFEMIVPLVISMAKGKNPPLVFSEESIRKFVDWVGTVTGGCLTCILAGANLSSLDLSLPPDYEQLSGKERDKVNDSLCDEAKRQILAKIKEQLTEFGISSEEMDFHIHIWGVWERKGTSPSCISVKDFEVALRKIYAQRQLAALHQ